jgi:hypothetical protein
MDNSSAPIVTLAGASSPLATDRCAVTGEDGRDGVLYLQPVPLLPTEAQVSPAVLLGAPSWVYRILDAGDRRCRMGRAEVGDYSRLRPRLPRA